MNTKLPNQDVADLLAPHSPEVRNLALPARSFVFPAMPDISEPVDAKVRIIGYGPKSADMVSMLMPTRTRVNLGIAFAVELHDPQNFWKALANCAFTSSSRARRTYRVPR
jgi:hypothetical protein